MKLANVDGSTPEQRNAHGMLRNVFPGFLGKLITDASGKNQTWTTMRDVLRQKTIDKLAATKEVEEAKGVIADGQVEVYMWSNLIALAITKGFITDAMLKRPEAVKAAIKSNEIVTNDIFKDPDDLEKDPKTNPNAAIEAIANALNLLPTPLGHPEVRKLDLYAVTNDEWGIPNSPSSANVERT